MALSESKNVKSKLIDNWNSCRHPCHKSKKKYDFMQMLRAKLRLKFLLCHRNQQLKICNLKLSEVILFDLNTPFMEKKC